MRQRVILIVVSTVFGGSSAAAARCLDMPVETPVRLTVAVDTSRSIRPEQLALWKTQISRLQACLVPGSAVRLLGLHAATAQAAARFEADIPPLSPPASIPQQVAIRNAVVQTRQDFARALDAAFDAPGNAEWTDIFGIFERLPPDPTRPQLLVLYTDGVQSTPALDWERTRVTESNWPTQLKQVQTLYLWRAGLLSGTRVVVVLPSLGGQAARDTVNTRATLGRVYRALVESLGGTLASFSVDLPAAVVVVRFPGVER